MGAIFTGRGPVWCYMLKTRHVIDTARLKQRRRADLALKGCPTLCGESPVDFTYLEILVMR